MCYDTIPVFVLYCGQSNGRMLLNLSLLPAPSNSSTPPSGNSLTSVLFTPPSSIPFLPPTFPDIKGPVLGFRLFIFLASLLSSVPLRLQSFCLLLPF